LVVLVVFADVRDGAQGFRALPAFDRAGVLRKGGGNAQRAQGDDAGYQKGAQAGEGRRGGDGSGFHEGLLVGRTYKKPTWLRPAGREQEFTPAGSRSGCASKSRGQDGSGIMLMTRNAM